MLERQTVNLPEKKRRSRVGIGCDLGDLAGLGWPREGSDWYRLVSDRQCLLRLCCALEIVLTWFVVILIPRAFLPSLMVLQ